MKIAISAESTVDLTQEILDKFDIKTIPLFVRLGENEFEDGTFPCSKIFEYVKTTKQLPKTSAINQEIYKDYFSGLLKEYDAVIHFSLSSKISSTCKNAQEASKELENIFVVDTLSLSTGIALFCVYARKLAEQGMNVKEIVKKCEERIPNNQTSFVITELNYLYKGGRCSSLALLGANLLKIKPQIIMENGSMRSNKKFIGAGEAIYLKYVKATLEQFKMPDLENVFLTYTTCPEPTIARIKRILIDYGFKNVYITTAGATITSYCGENCLGILYFNDGSNH